MVEEIALLTSKFQFAADASCVFISEKLFSAALPLLFAAPDASPAQIPPPF
ncbi:MULTISPECIES: hypothetical protein [Mycobacteriaceae]|uniref:hypothetical protein n=1 Tax=Mycobacteriaceae TaxID=1762 RepID=UPI0014094E48|nr:hypothetical protein [Mycolicibacterium mucogenicum]